MIAADPWMPTSRQQIPKGDRSQKMSKRIGFVSTRFAGTDLAGKLQIRQWLPGEVKPQLSEIEAASAAVTWAEIFIGSG